MAAPEIPETAVGDEDKKKDLSGVRGGNIATTGGKGLHLDTAGSGIEKGEDYVELFVAWGFASRVLRAVSCVRTNCLESYFGSNRFGSWCYPDAGT